MLKRLAIAATFLGVVLWVGFAGGDEVKPPPSAPPPPPTQFGDRMLNGHTFLFPVTFHSPFIATYFGVAQGVYNEHIPSVPVPIGSPADLDLLGYTASADLGVKITDWIGVQATGTALAVVGRNGESVIYAGGNLNAGGNVAPIVRIARIESTGTQVSARAQAEWLSGTALNIPRLLVLARSAIAQANGPVDAATTIGRGLLSGGLTRVVINGVDTFGLQASVEAAQALGPMFGFQGALTIQRLVNGVNFRNPLTGEVRDSATRYDALLNLSAEWDGMSLDVPVAAILEYELNGRLGGTGDELVEQDSAAVNTLGVGVYYSGRTNLQLGLFGAVLLNLRPVAGVGGTPGFSDAPNAEYLEMMIRYIW